MSGHNLTIIESPLSGAVFCDGVTVRVNIFRVGDDPRWALEVVNKAGTSVVWDDVFETDEAAFAAFAKTVALECIATFLDEEDGVAPPSATLH